MSIYRCAECGSIKDRDIVPCFDTGVGLICERCYDRIWEYDHDETA